MLSLIVAMARNRVIGAGGKLPWHLPADLKRFKQITMGRPVIMGRKTFESIGKPLPGRTNIVVTRRRGWTAKGCLAAHSLEEAIAAAGEGEVFVIGGGELYAAALRHADRLYVTEVDADVPGDTRFPELDMSRWRLVEETTREPDESNPYRCRFRVLEKSDR
ncbi:MAG TPA: dihydrofolate reductase [Planctomycetota bacterium]|nr:dihydrofolate reductase [Planctomycetota bacterium]